MQSPSQYADILPATNPDRIPSEAPPSCAEVTTSCTWAELVDVKTLTNSGISAPASVPHEMIDASFHQIVPSPRLGIIKYVTTKVRMMDVMDVTHTSEVRGASKSISSEFPYLARAIAPLTKYAAALESSMATRMTKIHTSSCTCVLGSWTASKIK